jgi:diguanylate cyclase (GGDEF)-like protein/PAS domain S-box-containing protein
MKSLIYYISEKIHFPNVKDKVTEELYKIVPKTLIAIFALASIFLYLFYTEVQNSKLLIIWFILLLILNSSRFYDYIQYQKQKESMIQKKSIKNHLSWYDLFKLKSILNAILWGVTPLLFFNDLNHTYQLIMIFFISGYTGAITGFLFDFRISSLFISILIFPLLFIVSFSTMPYMHIIQLLIFIFYMLLLISNKHLNQLFFQTYTNQERYHWAKDMLSLKEKKLSSLLDQAPIGIFYYDKDLRILSYNTLFDEIFALGGNLNGYNLNKLKDKKAIDLMKSVLEDKSSQKLIGSYNFSFQEKKTWVQLTCSALLDENGKIIGGIGTVEDKTIEHDAYEKINHISLHDSLTELPNRRSYQEYMLKLLEKDEHQHYYSLLFYMDLNHFKQINDTFGHIVGDKLLLEVADRLKALNIPNKYLSRIGGDEFIMIVPFYQNHISVAKAHALNIAKNIKESYSNTFEIEGLDIFMTTSIGIVLIEPKSDNPEQIIRQADMAMYQTKREGLNNIRFYDHSLDVEQRELTSLQHDLKAAIKNNELELHYQPIVSITTNKLNAIEALIRWNHPTKGLIMPNRFLPMATESGLITKIGWWVAKEVCRQLYVWKENKLINFEYISININARQLNEVNFVEHLNECITKGSISPSLLKLELTETTLLDNFSTTQTIIQRLKEKGIECSIDDFGTGYSSLSYLKKFAFKVLKIDKLFVEDIITNRDNYELVKSIVAIGKQFNYKIIIEGVETEEQKEKLITIDKDVYYQGYLCSKAIPSKEFEEKFL